MKTVAFTLWQNDWTLLRLWFNYYHKQFDDIFVICHATNKKYFSRLDQVKQRYNFDYSYTSEEITDPQRAVETFREKQKNLLTKYDWVLFSNCDEFIIPDPKLAKDLKQLMKKTKKDWIACTAYDVVQVEGETSIDYSKPFLKQRKYWARNKNYNKILLSRVPLKWDQGMHRIEEVSAVESKKIDNTSLYLIHTKHADWAMYGDPERDLNPPGNFHFEPWVVKAIEEKTYTEIPKYLKRF